MNRVLFKIHKIEQQRLYFRHHTKFKEYFQSSLINMQLCHNYGRFGKFRHGLNNLRTTLGTPWAQFSHDLSTILEQLRHGLGTFYAHK